MRMWATRGAIGNCYAPRYGSRHEEDGPYVVTTLGYSVRLAHNNPASGVDLDLSKVPVSPQFRPIYSGDVYGDKSHAP